MKALGLNLRNYLIKRKNKKLAIYDAKDKLKIKHILHTEKIPTSKTYYEIKDLADLQFIHKFPKEFVVKPNRGFGGNGILVLTTKDDHFVTPSGKEISLFELRYHIEKIIDGQYASYIEHDTAIIEERLYPSQFIQFKDPIGLPDIRIFCYNHKAIMAMIRYPTHKSDGKANLSAGALGIGINYKTGELTEIYEKKKHKWHPLSMLDIPKNYKIPHWKRIIYEAEDISKKVGLELSGVDLLLDHKDRTVVIEINGYPGLEIQNVNRTSLLGSIIKQSPHI